MKGIDVSTFQKDINWSKVAAGGYEFAIIKATQGRGEGADTKHLRRFTDSQFKRNIVGASDAGLACGVYHYMTAQTIAEARDEALYFCSVIAPYKNRITLWAAVDVESDMYLSKLAKYELAKIIREFMETVKASGYAPMLYINPNYLKYKLPEGVFDKDEIWLAHYTDKPMSVPNMRIWQHGVGKVSGIYPNCDLNEGYFNAAIPAVCRLAALGVIDSPAYWLEHYGDIKYLDELLIKSARAIKKSKGLAATFEDALNALVRAGVIDSPEYWRANADKVRYLPELICKLGGCV